LSPEQRSLIEIEGKKLSVSNLDKVLYPQSGFTKADVIWYYVHVAPVLLPHLRGRPLTMTRYPDGVASKSFFEKHSARKAPEWAHRARVPRTDKAKGSEFIEQIVVDDLATLVFVANLAALELHVPQWRAVSDGAYGPVDLIVFDLDPGAPATVVECCAVALWLRGELASRGLEAFAKTSGSKGLQLYARLEPPWAWERAHGEAREIAQLAERAHPGKVVSNMRRDLRQNKVLIDWSQNHAAKTTIAPYSLRALPVPSVSTPLQWEEVRRRADGGPDELRFLAPQVLERVAALGDLFAPLVGSVPMAEGSSAHRGEKARGAKSGAKR
jgi:bifunctional non-homologous end joining protein LigD